MWRDTSKVYHFLVQFVAQVLGKELILECIIKDNPSHNMYTFQDPSQFEAAQQFETQPYEISLLSQMVTEVQRDLQHLFEK